MIYLIGNAPKSNLYTFGVWENFKEWAIALKEFELDIETNIRDYWCTTKRYHHTK
jgi:hypothetical protein